MADRPRPADPAGDGLDWAFAGVFLLVAAGAWSALVLAELGLFSRAHLIALAGLVMAISGAAAAPSGILGRPRLPGAGAVVWTLVLIAGGWLVIAPPADPAVDGADETVYLHLGTMIARRGTLTPPDRLLAQTPPAAWDALLPTERHWPPRLNRFAGGIQVAPGDPTLEPNFFHLTPAWIAAVTVTTGSAGSALVPWATGWLAWLTPVAIFLAGRRMAGTLAGVAASGLLVLNAGFGWAGRLPLSEVPAGFLIASGVFFTAWWTSSGRLVPAALAGAAFGLAALDRIDALILVTPVAALVLATRAGAPGRRAALVPFGLLTAHAALHALTISRPYTLRVLGYVVRDRRTVVATSAALALVAVGAAALLLYRRLRPRDAARPRLAWMLVAVALAAIAARAAGGGNHLALLLTLPGLAVAGVSVVVLARRGDAPSWLVAGLVLMSALAYARSAFDLAGIPSAFRRDIPVLLPMACLAIGAAWLPPGASRRRLAAGTLAVLGLGAAMAQRTRAEWPLREAFDARPAVAALAAALPPDAVVLVDLGIPSHLDLALDFAYDRTAFAVDASLDHPQDLVALAAHSLHAGHPVYLVAASSGIDRPSAAGALRAFAFTPAGRFTLTTRRLAATTAAWPDQVRTASTTLTLHRMAEAVPLPWRVEIGGDDFGTVGSGWLTAEMLLGQAGRWATARATVVVPRLQCDAGRPLRGAVRMASLRPAGVRQPRVEVRTGPRLLLSAVPRDSAFHAYAFAVPPDLAAAACTAPGLWTITADTFVPRRDAALPDDRELGVAVDWLELATSP